MASIFFAAMVGAAVPLFFGWWALPGDENERWQSQAVRLVAYLSLAGYLATFVLNLTDTFHSFLLGIGLDVSVKALRAAASKASNFLVIERDDR
jgi:hypothetical protein